MGSIDRKVKFDDFLKIVKEVIVEKQDSAITPNNNDILTSDLGIDSLDVYDLILGVEDKVNLTIPSSYDEKYSGLTTKKDHPKYTITVENFAREIHEEIYGK